MEEELGSGESLLQNLTFEMQNNEKRNQSDYKNYNEGPEIVYEIDLNMTKSAIMQMIEKNKNEGTKIANSATKKIAGIIKELKEPLQDKKLKNLLLRSKKRRDLRNSLVLLGVSPL